MDNIVDRTTCRLHLSRNCGYVIDSSNGSNKQIHHVDSATAVTTLSAGKLKSKNSQLSLTANRWLENMHATAMSGYHFDGKQAPGMVGGNNNLYKTNTKFR